MDESGHDHVNSPYEVRGGICVHASNAWSLIQKIQKYEYFCFGAHLNDFKSEIKGEKLLRSKRFTFARQIPEDFRDDVRQELCRKLLSKGVRKESPSREELTAYGKASLLFVDGLLNILQDHNCKVFASRIPRGTGYPPDGRENLVRKDQYFLFQRFDKFLKASRESGVLVMDETDKQEDRRYVRSLHRLFVGHEGARRLTQTILPNPFFVASDMSYLVQAADVILYMLNHGYRLTRRDAAPHRMEIEHLDNGRIRRMVDIRKLSDHNRRYFTCYSVFDVNDPWEYRERIEEGNAFEAVFRAPRGRASN